MGDVYATDAALSHANTHTSAYQPEKGPSVKAFSTVNNPVYLGNIKRMLRSEMSKPAEAQLGEGRAVKKFVDDHIPPFLCMFDRSSRFPNTQTK